MAVEVLELLTQLEPASDTAAPELIARSGQTIVLNETLRPRELRTASAAQFKAWIGLPDAIIEEHPLLGLPEAPAGPWSRGRDVSVELLSDGEWRDVQRAAKAYFFGHSALVASYEPAIEAFFGPFAADAFAIRRLVVEAGARVILAGRAAVLRIDELEIHEGGRLEIQTIARIFVETLRKEPR